jgi:hypothetical protein
LRLEKINSKKNNKTNNHSAIATIVQNSKDLNTRLVFKNGVIMRGIYDKEREDYILNQSNHVDRLL